MGFRLGRIYALEFAGTGLEGAVVKLRSPSIDTLDALLADGVTREEQWKLMLAHLEEWNFETAGGEPVPHTVEAMTAHMELGVPQLILKEWYRAGRGITGPLDERSSDGEQLPEEESSAPPMQMETL